MTATNPNIETLKKHLVTIKDKGKSYCITINTVGHLIYILNDGIGLYVLLVPNNKLTIEDSHKVLNLEGWTEKFLLINFHKSYEMNSIDILLSEIEKILIDVLRIPKERNWRFEVNSGMMIVKANEISLDAATRREIIKKKANSPIRKILNILTYPFKSNLRMSISVTIILATISFYRDVSLYSAITYKYLILTIGMGVLCYIALQLKYPDKK